MSTCIRLHGSFCVVMAHTKNYNEDHKEDMHPFFMTDWCNGIWMFDCLIKMDVF